MTQYLSKEEIRQWRSSLEKITLEEYAARLGKIIQQEKTTNDIVDIVMTKNTLENMTVREYKPKAETIKNIVQKSIEKEKELINKYNIRVKMTQQPLSERKEKTINIDNEKFIKEILDEKPTDNIELSFKKSLTPRENLVLNYFKDNQNTIVYAKDLAQLLELPRDYIYKYIKTLRNKLEQDVIFNAENGGFIFKTR